MDNDCNLNPKTGGDNAGSSANLQVINKAGLRLTFLIKLTDFGMEQLYLELESLPTNSMRLRHVKRQLLEITRGSFQKPAASPYTPPTHDRPSFKLQMRLSDRDVGLEALLEELSPLLNAFTRNNAVRRKLFDAYLGTSLISNETPLTRRTMVIGTAGVPPQELFGQLNQVQPQRALLNPESLLASRAGSILLFNV